ncbi:tyrosine--tRNA ligase [Mycoplasma sp. NEAQ87857]|uniref:tyrosine--tRNA ligase n=1 Tax=Mycoplasma sp. NEAQ87857 TaxID=2683967 RepID=UPI0013198BC6|nr:tyrosine--tRNA ligase [Mycoplasma sp. NEAQ87857]
MDILHDLESRGILKQISNRDKLIKLDPATSSVYAGFDPTATSLHLGNYIQISILLRFKKMGWKTYALIGGATGMIGDPSFKDSERQLLDNNTILNNKNHIRNQLESFGLEVIDNYDFYKDMNVLDFIRDVGKMVNVSYLLAKDSVASRISKGLSFTEFSYSLIQGWDFLTLYKTKNICVQFGGSDQWGNITTGLDMISKTFGDEHKAVALTSNLLTDSNGNKFGKSTGGGSLWLDKSKTKPYAMYQFLVTQPDSQVEKLLKWLTFLPINEIDEIIKVHNENPANQYAQKVLAKLIVGDIHGEKEVKKAITISHILFDKKLDYSSLTINDMQDIENEITTVSLEKDKNLIEQLVANKLVQSKRQAREFLQTQAIKINGQAIDESYLLTSEIYNNQYALLNIGKKNIFLVKLV